MSDLDEYKETWFIVPRSILDLPNLKLCHLKVFETIFQFWNKNRKCFLSNPEISRRTGIAITQVKEAVLFFEKHKELERIQIGLKRYLMQPLKVVEIPGLELVPKEVALNQASCIEVTQVALNRAGGGPKSGQVVASNRATEIKKLNKEIKKPIIKGFAFEEALKENPHNLSLEILEEWNAIRIRKHKSPLTERAWKRTNTVLSVLVSKGLKLNDIIDRMLSAEWRGVEVSYFKNEIQELNPKPNRFPTPDERAAEQHKIIERENKAAAEKRKEVQQTQGGIKELIQNVDMKAIREKQEAERMKLGMTVSEYHQYIIRGKNG